MAKFKKTFVVLVIAGSILLFGGCFPDTPVVPAPTTTITPMPTEIVEEAETPERPTKEEVLAMRDLVRAGIERNDFDRLTQKIKDANLWMENQYVHHDLFEILENENHEYWDRDVTDFIEFISRVKESAGYESFKLDLQYIIDQTQLAKETRKVEYANNLYKALHDMDYFLLRYGLEDVGIYVKEKGILAKYYGVLHVFQGEE